MGSQVPGGLEIPEPCEKQSQTPWLEGPMILREWSVLWTQIGEVVGIILWKGYCSARYAKLRNEHVKWCQQEFRGLFPCQYWYWYTHINRYWYIFIYTHFLPFSLNVLRWSWCNFPFDSCIYYITKNGDPSFQPLFFCQTPHKLIPWTPGHFGNCVLRCELLDLGASHPVKWRGLEGPVKHPLIFGPIYGGVYKP